MFIVDIEGFTPSAEETAILKHPYVTGVLLFSRNVVSEQQLLSLINEIKAIRPDILLAIDHEGGTVQRLQRYHFRAIPAARVLGEIYDRNQNVALELATHYGQQVAHDLQQFGIHLSLSPVLDLHVDGNPIIAALDRAYHHNPLVVTELARAFILGMKAQGMPAVGKHFPGHGSTSADSHTSTVICERSVEQLLAEDMLPFQQLIEASLLDAIMPAHVLYPAIDSNNAAGYSAKVLDYVKQFGFNGIIISDCLGMVGADIGDLSLRAQHALSAGCDLLIVANQSRDDLAHLLDQSFDQRNSLGRVEDFKALCLNSTRMIKMISSSSSASLDAKKNRYNNTQHV